MIEAENIDQDNIAECLELINNLEMHKKNSRADARAILNIWANGRLKHIYDRFSLKQHCLVRHGELTFLAANLAFNSM